MTALAARLSLVDVFPSLAKRRLARPPLALRHPSTPSVIHRPGAQFFSRHPRPRLLPRRHFWTSRIAREGTQAAAVEEAPQGLFGRVKELTRKYGGSALAVYLGLSVLDFGVTFVLIYAIGAEHVRSAEDWVLEQLHWRRQHPHEEKPIAEAARDKVVEAEDEIKNKASQLGEVIKGEASAGAGPKDQSTLATTALLAYAIHKTVLMPFRIGLTAWATPKIVHTLRAWGWNVGRNLGKPAAASALLALDSSPSRRRDRSGDCD